MTEPMRTVSGHTVAIPIPGATGARRPRPYSKVGRSSSWSSSNSGSCKSDTSAASRGSGSGNSDLIFGPMEGLTEEPYSCAPGRPNQHQYLYSVANVPRTLPPEPPVCARCGQPSGHHMTHCEREGIGFLRRSTIREGNSSQPHEFHAPERHQVPERMFAASQPGYHQTMSSGAMQPDEGLLSPSRTFPFSHAGPSSGHLPAGITPAMLPAESFTLGSPPRSFPISRMSFMCPEGSVQNPPSTQGRARSRRRTRTWAARPPADRR
ncbi:hypothetical protein OBBRIDRAFT_156809 [Obba rivulosa]|uniref:Uncharacterized protein n=1 Tax=Obba rivulosa TaxID=1052685 RepID=A0A8E2DHS2_9APHY|nr:hypothetical protein OBBRIDRAFT_156809 [Obba rivulosa]